MLAVLQLKIKNSKAKKKPFFAVLEIVDFQAKPQPSANPNHHCRST
jgi:hypothetical protein